MYDTVKAITLKRFSVILEQFLDESLIDILPDCWLGFMTKRLLTK